MEEDEELTPMQKCAALFACQHGVAADRQIRAAGISLKRQNAMVANQVWTRLHPGVLALAGMPDTWERQVMAATLAVKGAVACVRTAARLHGLDGYRYYGGIKIAVPRSVRRITIPNVKYTRLTLDDEDTTVVMGIPVTTVAVTLIHLVSRGLNAAQPLDDALRRGHKPEALRAEFERWKRSGVRGPSEMLELLADRVDRRLPRSWFQRIAKDIFIAEAIHFVDEWPVYDTNGKHLADLDLANVDLKVGVECQSWEWHGSPSAQQKDLHRKRRLRKLGWDIVDVWWSDLLRADEVLSDVRIVLASARARNLAADRANQD